MLCPLLSRFQVDPATGKGEWSHLECLGAQCMFYNVPEADCQFLLGARAGNVSLPAAGSAETLKLSEPRDGEPSRVLHELLEKVEEAGQETRRQVQSSLDASGERLRRLEESLEALGGLRQAVERLEGERGREPGKKALAQMADRLETLEGRQSEVLEAVRGGDPAAGAALSRLAERLEALGTGQAGILDALRGEEARAGRDEERWGKTEQQGREIQERLRELESGHQEALHALQAFRDAVSALPSRQEALAERIQNGLDEALKAQGEAFGSRLEEELKTHAGEQARQLEAQNESAVRNHGRLLQTLKKTEQAQETALAAVRPEIAQVSSGVAEARQAVEKLSASVHEVRAAMERSPAEFQGLGKQLRDLHQFTRDALDAARQRAEGSWSQVETVGRSIGQLALIVKGLQEEVERANGSLSAVRTENKSLLLAFHEQKMATQEEQRCRLTEQARELNNKGVALFHRGSLEAAIEAFIRAVELKPDYAEAYNNLGLAYSKRGQSEESVRYFQKALEIDPQLGEVYNNLGFLFHASARYERAVEMFTRSLQTGADQSIAYTNLGNTFYKMKQNDRAVASWKKALEIDPLNESARRGLAMFQQEPAGPAAGKA